MDEQPGSPANNAPPPPVYQPPHDNPVPSPTTLNVPRPDLVAGQPQQNSQQPNVPTTWPGAFGLYKYSRQAVMLNVWAIIVLWLIANLAAGGAEWKLKLAGSVIGLIVGALFQAALTLVFITGVRGQPLSISHAVSQSLPLWLKMIGLTILLQLSYIASLLLLIVPFFFVVPRLVLANYFLVDKNLGVMDSYKASWTATKGYAQRIWGVIGVTVLMALLVITIIGIPLAIYFLLMYSAAFAVLYEFINKAVQPSVPPAPAEQSASSPSPPTQTPPNPQAQQSASSQSPTVPQPPANAPYNR